MSGATQDISRTTELFGRRSTRPPGTLINQTLAASALATLAQLFRYGRLTNHGAFFNAKTGQMCALPVDPRQWQKARRRARKNRSH